MNNYYPPPGEPEGERGFFSGPQARPIEISPGRPVVVYTILGLTVLVFLAQLASEALLGGIDLPAALGMKVNALILRGELWRLLTPMLLHGSILHIGFNMYALYAFGPGLEHHYGKARFITLYILAGFAGNVVSFLFSPANSLGSSTAIFGLLGAEGVFLYQNRAIFGNQARQALTQIMVIAGINLFIGLSPGIDNWGHIGGLLGGVAFAWLAGPLLDVRGIYPIFSITDRRSRGEVLRAGVGVALFFAALAAVAIFTRL